MAVRGARAPGAAGAAAIRWFAQWKGATVSIDYHVELDRAYYSVPYRYARQKVDVRSTATSVEVFKQGERIASHPRSLLKGRHTTTEAHLAPAHQAVAGWSAQRFLDWAATVGPQTQAAIEQVLASRVHPQQGYRAALGILRLGKTHGEEALEQPACAPSRSRPSPTAVSLRSSARAWSVRPPPRPRPPSPPTTPMGAAPSTTTEGPTCSTIPHTKAWPNCV